MTLSISKRIVAGLAVMASLAVPATASAYTPQSCRPSGDALLWTHTSVRWVGPGDCNSGAYIVASNIDDKLTTNWSAVRTHKLKSFSVWLDARHSSTGRAQRYRCQVAAHSASVRVTCRNQAGWRVIYRYA